MLLLGLTNLLGVSGGIPAFNRLLCRCAWEWTQERGQPLTVLALMDAADARRDQDVLPPGVRYRGYGGDRRRFTAALLWRGAAGPVCLGHVNLAPLGLALRCLGRRVAVVAHGTEVWQPLPPLRRLALQRAWTVACVSDHTAAQACAVQGVAPARVQRVINALDPYGAPLPPPPVFQVLDDAAPATEAPRLLSVTRLHPEEPKGVDLVLQALPAVPGARYDIIGEGEARPALEALARRLGVGERVRFLGRVSDLRREEALRGCDVFVLPSSGEGFGIVYLEAMAHGKPCLAARRGGAPEVVLDGETGLLVEPEVASVAAALQVLCGDAGLRARLGRAGYERVRERFTFPAFRQAAFHLFDRLGG